MPILSQFWVIYITKFYTSMQTPRIITLILLFTICIANAQTKKPRARDLKIPFDGTPGKLNAITDVPGIEVGHKTIIKGEGKLEVGKGPARTGVTAIFPLGKNSIERVFASWFTLNGNGEMTGTTWIDESGCLGSPILITNTHSVGTVRDAVIQYYVDKKLSAGGYSGDYSLPVVAETWDGFLNDINGFHVKQADVFEALQGATTGPVAEGNVGGGTGMIVHSFKGGIGTSSRIVETKIGTYTVGVLVQANYGSRSQLTISGVPVGKEITDLKPTAGKPDEDQGSIIVVAATDAPFLPHQLDRFVKRVALGVGAVGGRGGNSSGDIFIAFSTANPEVGAMDKLANLKMFPNEMINPFFDAVAQATEESIINAMIAAETMVGRDGNKVYAIPHDRLIEAMKKYNRLK
ncbi:MAG: P1 family peptidase [Cyclobacteriaceae bacterium]